jgi:DNA-binding MarR family transcriptional regulator
MNKELIGYTWKDELTLGKGVKNRYIFPVISSLLQNKFFDPRFSNFRMSFQILADHARSRLEIARRERVRFRLAPQIALEILLILAAEGGSSPLTSLFDRIAAAEKSVRSHVRTLTALGLVHEERDAADKRAKTLRLTPRGLQDLLSYAQECCAVGLESANRA